MNEAILVAFALSLMPSRGPDDVELRRAIAHAAIAATDDSLSGPSDEGAEGEVWFLEDAGRPVAPFLVVEKNGPGLAKVPAGAVGARVVLEDGTVLARTDVSPGELVADVEARLRLAVGQRGGLR